MSRMIKVSRGIYRNPGSVYVPRPQASRPRRSYAAVRSAKRKRHGYSGYNQWNSNYNTPSLGFYKQPMLGSAKYVTLKTAGTIHNADAGVGGFSSYRVTINDARLPFGGAGGAPAFGSQQPAGFDQMAGLYDRHVTEKGQVKWIVHNAGTEPMRVYSYCSSQSIRTAEDDIAAAPNVQSFIIPADSSKTLYCKFDTSNIFGKSWKWDEGQVAEVTASPTRLAYCHLYTVNSTIAEAASASAHITNCELVQRVRFDDPKNVEDT